MTAASRTVNLAAAIFGSASGHTQRLTDGDAVLRAPLALCRRVGFIQLRGGAGATTTAAYVASLLAHRRTGMVLGVDAAGAPGAFARTAGIVPLRDADEPEVDRSAGARKHSDRRAAARTAEDARAGLPVSGSGLLGLDLATEAGHRGAASANTWFGQVAPIARFYDVVCTDWGVRPAAVDLRQAAATSHVVCLVARADRHAAEEVAAAIPALLALEDRPRVVLALVDVGQTGDRAPALLRPQLAVPVLSIPYDPVRASDRPIGSRRLFARTRLAYARLAGELLSEAQRPAYRRLGGPS